MPKRNKLPPAQDDPAVPITPVYTVPEAQKALKCSKSTLYTLINQGAVQRVKAHGKTFVTKKSVEQYWRRILTEEQTAADERDDLT